MATTPPALITGTKWKFDKYKERWVADFDPNAERDIPIAWVDFFADLGSPYGSHVVIAASPLVALASSEADGVIRVRIATDGTGTLRRYYPFTVRATAANGERDDQTLWLRLVEH